MAARRKAMSAEIPPVVTLEEVKRYLPIDFEDDATNATLTRLIAVADSYLRGAIGKDYPRDDERVKQIALLVVSDLFENRDFGGNSGGYVKQGEKVSGSMRLLVADFAMQIRMEMRGRDV